MKSEQLLIRLESEELDEINRAFKKELIAGDDAVLSRSEFIRRLIKLGLGAQEKASK